ELVKSRAERHRGVIFRLQDQHVRGSRSRRAIRPVPARADTRREVKRDVALSVLGIPDEEREHGTRNAAGPQPVDIFRFYAGQTDNSLFVENRGRWVVRVVVGVSGDVVGHSEPRVAWT